ncbi:hypothetical protein AXA84_0086 [Candidatus Phytoplasma oryzae]|uniref:Uncharacterized protein n=1 Tax=Candidatus Phytoplasma oryzae TaxID=203274 RepID=A0A139JR33_9MOLU|nr:hypothetical protein AXA84_0086 [Candidatus Phytoplasma oryzae]
MIFSFFKIFFKKKIKFHSLFLLCHKKIKKYILFLNLM